VLSKAEIKPVEPEQGNACEGKVTAISAPLLIAIPCSQYFKLNNEL
jgi:hypothetical protein